jgi:microcystin-dependent protein
MSQPYIGEIRCFGFNFAPSNWAFCNGQLMNISDNEALYTVIGTTYGGDGVNTFGMPNLQGRVPMHWGNGAGGFNTAYGQVQGSTTVTLTTAQMPAHAHTIMTAVVAPGGAPERTATPANPTHSTYIGTSDPDGLYKSPPPTLDATFAPAAIGGAGGSQPHENMQPYLALNFCICLYGIYPSQN